MFQKKKNSYLSEWLPVMAPNDKILWNSKTLGTKGKSCKCGSRVGSLGEVSTEIDFRFLDSNRGS